VKQTEVYSVFFLGDIVQFVNEKIDFYEIDFDYMTHLYKHDNNVYYHSSYKSKLKPYIGVLLNNNGIKYFVPLTSAKPKHINLKLITKDYLMINKLVDVNEQEKKAIYKTNPEDNTTKYRITSMLDLRKMIPVPEDKYKKVELASLDLNYQFLLYEEHRFCIGKQDMIKDYANKLYEKTKSKGQRISKFHCDYVLLESIMSL